MTDTLSSSASTPEPRTGSTVTSVTAVVVSRGRTPFLETTLHALAAQRRLPGRLVLVDVGGTPDPALADLLRAVGLGPTPAEGPAVRRGRTVVRLEHAPRARTFGDAVRQAVATVPDPPGDRGGAAGPTWLWLLHDDSAPEPDALAELLRAVEAAPSVGIAGVKQRTWTRPARLLEIGLRTSRSGRRMTDVEPGEVDQGQHDGRDDVLGVGIAGALVRRDVWDTLRGTDPALGPFGDGLDLSRRARLAGHRVVVVPSAVVRHAQASYHGLRGADAGPEAFVDLDADGEPDAADPRRSYAARRTALLHQRLVWPPLPLVPLVAVMACLAGLVRLLVRIAAKEPQLAAAEVSAPLRALGRPGAVVRARGRIRRTRRLSRRTLRPLQGDLRTVWQQWQDRRLTRREARRVVQAPSELELRELAALAVRRRIGLAVVTVLLVALSAVAFGRQIVPVIGGDSLVGGALVRVQTGLGTLWQAATDGWVTTGLGERGPADALLTALLPLSALAGGRTDLVLAVLLLGAALIAGVGAWFAAGAATRSVTVRAWAAVAWAALPSLVLAAGQGRVGAVLVHVALPWCALGLARAVGVHQVDTVLSGVATAVRGVDAPRDAGVDEWGDPEAWVRDGGTAASTDDEDAASPEAEHAAPTDDRETDDARVEAAAGSGAGPKLSVALPAPDDEPDRSWPGGDAAADDGSDGSDGGDLGPTRGRVGGADDAAAAADDVAAEAAPEDEPDAETSSDDAVPAGDAVPSDDAVPDDVVPDDVVPADDPAVDDAPAGRPRPTGSIAAAAGASLAFAVVVAGAPALLPAGVLVLVAVAVCAPRRRRLRVLAVALPALVLVGPTLVEAASRGREGLRLLLADPGSPLASTAATPLAQLLGVPVQASELVPSWLPSWVPSVVSDWWPAATGAVLVLLALLALLRGAPVARAVRLGWFTAAVGLALAVVSGRVAVAQDDGTVVVGWAGTGVSLAMAGLLTAAVLGTRGVRVALDRYTFGWRQLGVAVLALVAVVVPLVQTGTWAWEARRADAAELTTMDRSVVPAIGRQTQASQDSPRVLALTAGTDDVTTWQLWRGDGPLLTEDAAAVRTRLLTGGLTYADATATDDATTEIEAVVAALSSGASIDLSSALAALGIADVQVPPVSDDVSETAARTALIARLDATPGLERITEGETGVIWRVQPVESSTDAAATDDTSEATTDDDTSESTSTGSTASALTAWARLVPDATAAADAEGLTGSDVVAVPADGTTVDTTIEAGSEDRLLVLAERADSGWHATLDGEPLRAVTDGWRQTFAVGADGGHLVVTYESTDRTAWTIAQGGVGLLALLLALPVRRRRTGRR
ncbi:MAG TPA: glycosyltransferase [Cellulomonas sp.]